jgi:hypothetical protein
MRERFHLEDLGVYGGRDNIKIFKKQDGGRWTALIRLTTGTSGVLL